LNEANGKTLGFKNTCTIFDTQIVSSFNNVTAHLKLTVLSATLPTNCTAMLYATW